MSTLTREKNELIDPRTISKKHDQVGRDVTAATIVRVKTDIRATQDQVSVKQEERKTQEQQLDEIYKQQGQLSAELATRTKSKLVKLKKLLGFKDKTVSAVEGALSDFKTQRYEILDNLTETEEELDSLEEKLRGIPRANELLQAYKEKSLATPLTDEEKRELLTPEVLATLSTDEYIRLWQRLNPHFLTHVTRQGFRDHNAMFYHSAGMMEFHGGLVALLEDDKQIRPPIALEGLRTRDEVAVKSFMGDWILGADDEKEAKTRFHGLMHFHLASAPKYPDVTAVHFAAQLAADDYYGGETENEVFFAFPTDVLASQHNFGFNGWEKDFTKAQSETKWNDVFVWPKSLDNPGISVDSGLVFLPETTPVDPETGSKYASEIKQVDGVEKRVMIEDSKLVNSFVEWGKSLDENSSVRQAYTTYNQERNYWRQQDLRGECLAVFTKEVQKLGFSEDAAADLGRALFGEMHLRVYQPETLSDPQVLEGLVRKSGANWKRAENTIPAKEFWEKYFESNPHLRPKHIIYYSGDPTAGVYKFLQDNNIGRADTSKNEGELLGFQDHLVTDMEQDPRANKGLNELTEMGTRIISNHFQSILAKEPVLEAPFFT